MKCQKCGYLGFEQTDRCRNCGYEFSLSAVSSDAELSLKTPAPEIAPIEDLSFLKQPHTPQPGSDLPLFEPIEPDDQPLITKASPPRPPLSVRRATEVPRPRPEPKSLSFDLAFESDALDPSPVRPEPRVEAKAQEHVVASGAPSAAEPLTPVVQPLVAAASAATIPQPKKAAAPIVPSNDPQPHAEDRSRDATLAARLAGVVIDLFILASVDIAVVYLTMQLCGVTFFELGILPKAPLLAFIALQNGGYIVGFTAGGQTLGKMVMGIRVVSADDAGPIGVGSALERTLLWAILAAPAGIGLLTALFSSDHRGLHDRLAGTRVIRASA